MYLYPISLLIISTITLALERLYPWRKDQAQLRPRLWSDGLHLVFNGHFLGAIFYGISLSLILPILDPYLAQWGLIDTLYRGAASQWSLPVQIIISLLGIDFLQWCVHNLLHRVNWLWEMHKCHHSVQKDEMDWIVAFRFQWTEVVVYRFLLYFPLAFFAFSPEALMFHAIFGTLIGHLNHSNLDITWGPLKYILNSPRMHIWHHDYDREGDQTVNFGIIFSLWDWLFGTAYLPSHAPQRLGFFGDEHFPKTFFAQMIWPLNRLVPTLYISTLMGIGLLCTGWWAKDLTIKEIPSLFLGEQLASSQPLNQWVHIPPEESEKALALFGSEARQKGYIFPQDLVSVSELKQALGAPSLVLLDVRPTSRFKVGHIPSALSVYRGDYSLKKGIKGLSKSAQELKDMLNHLGVFPQSTLVLYGDGGPEPYRLWWTLKSIAGIHSRILDGGLKAWKLDKGPLVEGMGPQYKPIQSKWENPQNFHPFWGNLYTWNQGKALQDSLLIDTRSSIEFSGQKRHSKAGRAGRIPKSKHLDWMKVLDANHHLLTPSKLNTLFEHTLGIPLDQLTSPLITYCQSGTRSAVVFFALYQLGVPSNQLYNYDGSWSEYSHRLDLPIESDFPSHAPKPSNSSKP